jgi:hypothetical protein
MKTTNLVIAGLLFFSTSQIEAAGPRVQNPAPLNPFWYNWSVDLNAGLTTYYGDLSQYDLSVLNKLLYESKPAFGLKVTKHIKHKFGLSGQLIYGGFKSDYKPGHVFETRLFEYNVQASADVLNLFNNDNKRDFGLTVYVGAGQFLFRTTGIKGIGEDETTRIQNSGVPEFVYFFGSSYYHKISQRFNLTVDLSIRQAQNDNLDNYIAHGDFDYYSYLSVGISFLIDNLKTPFRKVKECPAFDDYKTVWRDHTVYH